MISIEELKQKYGPAVDVAPYGSCIIVPGSEFNPDWEAELGDQGIKVFLTSLNQRPVTLVQVKKQVGVATPKRGDTVQSTHAVKDVTPSQAQRTSSKTRVMFDPESRWTDSDKQLLAKLWNQKLKVLEIIPKFPKRSEASIRMELARLIKDGVILGRWKKGGKRDFKRLKRPIQKAEKELKGPEGLEPASLKRTPDLKIDTPVRNAPEDPAFQKLVETVGALTDVVDKVSCNAVMHALEIRELKGKDDFKIPLGLWTAYSSALLSDDKKYRDVFRDKVRKLLEASS
jgi:hypothetical protein